MPAPTRNPEPLRSRLRQASLENSRRKMTNSFEKLKFYVWTEEDTDKFLSKLQIVERTLTMVHQLKGTIRDAENVRRIQPRAYPPNLERNEKLREKNEKQKMERKAEAKMIEELGVCLKSHIDWSQLPKNQSNPSKHMILNAAVIFLEETTQKRARLLEQQVVANEAANVLPEEVEDLGLPEPDGRRSVTPFDYVDETFDMPGAHQMPNSGSDENTASTSTPQLEELETLSTEVQLSLSCNPFSQGLALVDDYNLYDFMAERRAEENYNNPRTARKRGN